MAAGAPAATLSSDMMLEIGSEAVLQQPVTKRERRGGQSPPHAGGRSEQKATLEHAVANAETREERWVDDGMDGAEEDKDGAQEDDKMQVSDDDDGSASLDNDEYL